MDKAARGIYRFLSRADCLLNAPSWHKDSRHQGPEGTPHSDPTAASCLTAMLLQGVYC